MKHATMTFLAYWLALLLISAIFQAQRGLSDVTNLVTNPEPVENGAEETKTSTCNDAQCQETNNAECGIWLATSTIPGSGLGMFAGRDFLDKEELTESGDIVIPLVDIDTHQKHFRYHFVWDDYTWEPEPVLMEHLGLVEVNCASPGFGAAANSYLDLHNVDEWTPECDGAGLNRREDPGAGAFSAHHNRRSTAKGFIRAGQELFVSYGGTWFTGREHLLGAVPIKGDHAHGEVLLNRFKRMKTKLDDSLTPILDEMWTKFLMKSPFLNSSRILNALPSSWEDMEFATKYGLLNMRKRKHTVSQEWLHEHGTCMDNIRIAPSTIRQAGRGAFATRFLPQGTVVAPMPMIHIPHKKRFQMHELEKDAKKDKYVAKDGPPVGWQLMTNYCYGHANSTLLLCPYGLMTAAVNHNQTLANVRLQWSEPNRTGHRAEWLNLTVEKLISYKNTGLIMEFVATRDIQPGEEIFLDYGDEWEEAWNNHLRNWKPAEGFAEFPSSDDLNAEKEKNIRTAFDLLDEPYPENVELQCEKAFKYTARWNRFKQMQKGTAKDYLHDVEAGREYCDVIRRERDESGEVSYTAVLYTTQDGNETSFAGKLKNVPVDAFVFVDKPYKSDMHLPNAFRHEIMIPDDIFPDNWKNAGDP